MNIFQTITKNSMDSREMIGDGLPSDYVDVSSNELVAVAVAKDNYQIPKAEDREGYFKDNNAAYWLSGYYDAMKVKRHIPNISNVLDIGCASGRVLRHLSLGLGLDAWGCDINYRHVRWISKYLPESCRAVQITTLPHLPFADNEFSAVVAFSVFTHQEILDTSWIAEIRRVLAVGGKAYITIHTESTWNAMKPEHRLYQYIQAHPSFSKEALQQPLEGDKTIFQFGEVGSYKVHTFHHTSYIKQVWGRILEIEDILNRYPDGQDVVVLRKR